MFIDKSIWKRIKIFTSAKKCVLGGDFSPKPFGAFFYKTKNFDPLLSSKSPGHASAPHKLALEGFL